MVTLGRRAPGQSAAVPIRMLACGEGSPRSRPIEATPLVNSRSPDSLSVVVPLHDEAPGVPALASTLGELLRGADREIELVLVDDGSRDDTLDRLEAAFPAGGGPWRVLRHTENRGLTAALRTGSEAARHACVGWLDADLTYDPSVLLELARAVDAGADLAWASCHHPAGQLVGVSPWRASLSRLASGLYRRAAGHPELYTFTCMVRVQRREVLAATLPERGGFLGVAEQLLRALAQGARVTEVPATLHRRRVGQSKMRVLHAGLGHLGLLWAARRGRLRSRPADQRSTR